MSRSLRIQYPNVVYHVMNRSAEYRNIFSSDEDRELFLSLLKQVHYDYWTEIHAYCLMDNHFHILIRTPEANLSQIMTFIESNYARKLNKKIRLDGPLFRGRYKSILIDANSYFLNVSRYIHLNPVEAFMVNAAEDYYWSSFSFYVGFKKKRKIG